MDRYHTDRYHTDGTGQATEDSGRREEMGKTTRRRVEKNEKRQQRNMEEAAVASKMDQKAIKRGDHPNMDNARTMKRKELENQILISKTATASAGKFDAPLEGDLKPRGIKRQLSPMIGDVSREKAGNMSILDKLLARMGKIS
ncbi:MAG: hypothetical protein J3Q66DRAFT_72818 [Benniella sp.]|nr:MAG: hypothetical protein J3Q66DRAFT_72818 [Benniella sp.]